ncbi:MAG: hypothetical protein R3Y68_00480 [Rikenellaceae bacterium]
MREKFNLSRLYPLFAAIVLYTIFALAYFAPQLSGEVIVQGDITQYRGMTQDIIETREATGEDPQWTGSMFGGMPAYLINVDYSGQIIKRAAASVTNLVSTPAAFLIFAMLSMWLMLVMMGVNGWVAIAGGAMYGLSTYFMLIIEAGHVTKMWALVYAPAMMGSIYAALRSGSLWCYALAALFTSLELGANHPQITYYFLMAAAALWLSELYDNYKEVRLDIFFRRTALLCVAGLLGVMSNFAPLWYTAQHTPDTMRGGSELVAESSSQSGGLDLEYATAWSYGVGESLNLLIPDFMGRDSSHTFAESGEVAQTLKRNGIDPGAAQMLPMYWGDQPFTAGPTYLGAVVLFLACLGFVLSSGRERWWIGAISLIMLMLAWGSNFVWFTELMFKILPGYNKFRTVSMTLVVVQWTAPLLATFALSKLWLGEYPKDRIVRIVSIAAASTAGLCVALIAASGLLLDFGYGNGLEVLLNIGLDESLASQIARAMVAERGSLMAADALRSAIYITLAAALLLSYLFGKLSRGVMVAGVAAVAMIDLAAVDMRFLNQDDFRPSRAAKIIASDANRQIMEDKGDSGASEYRVLNLAVSPFNDATTSYFHRSVGGYHGAKLSRYQDIIDRYLAYGNPTILDMLNTRYTISAEGEVVDRSDSALGAAWIVEAASRVKSAESEIAQISKISLSQVAVVDENQSLSRVRYNPNAKIKIEEYHPHYQRYSYTAEGETLAVFSEIYYDKGWSAYIDGVEAPYIRANYILRAMELPAGEHTVEWRFRAPRWGVVNGITLISSLVILLSLIAVIYIFFHNFVVRNKINERDEVVEAD